MYRIGIDLGGTNIAVGLVKGVHQRYTVDTYLRWLISVKDLSGQCIRYRVDVFAHVLKEHEYIRLGVIVSECAVCQLCVALIAELVCDKPSYLDELDVYFLRHFA